MRFINFGEVGAGIVYYYVKFHFHNAFQTNQQEWARMRDEERTDRTIIIILVNVDNVNDNDYKRPEKKVNVTGKCQYAQKNAALIKINSIQQWE